MRLGALFLTGAALTGTPLAAQGPRALPWEGVPPLAWQGEPWKPGTAGAPSAPESGGGMVLHLAEDGTLRVSDARGLVRLQAGLPGRPLKLWRDGGIPLAAASGSWRFPAETPLSHGFGNLQWCADDFRPFLAGLLWILEDGEGFLSVVHPATGRLIHLPLPLGHDLSLRFLPDRLQVASGQGELGVPRQWSLPWMGLLPRLAALGPRSDPSKVGTALLPFPKD